MKWIEKEVPTHKLNKAKWVECIAEIRSNETGEVVEYETDEILYDGHKTPSTFNWIENNFSCDCNRRMFFDRVKGNEEEDFDCTYGLFSVNLKNKLDGVVYYREFDK